MAKQYLLGIDVGTSRIKAVLFDSKGNTAFSSWRDSQPYSEGNHSEIDMDELWLDVSATIKDVLNQREEGAMVAGVAVSGQGEGLWLIDAHGNPVGRAILWNDTRASGMVKTLEEIKKINDNIRRITGSSLFPGATSVLLRWLGDNNPEQLKKASSVIFCKDWIRYKLTNIVGTDFSDASSSLLDIIKAEPTEELWGLLDIGKHLSLFPQCYEPSDYVATVTPEAAKMTGLEKGTPVGAGAFDVVATAVGCGAIKFGDACSILGTSGCNMVVSDVFNPDPNGRTGSELHAISGRFLNVSASMAATPNLDWLYGLFHKDQSFSKIEEQLKSVPAGCGGIMYHPYISSSGERAPFYSVGARAQFTGIDEKTTPLIMTRAVYEGVGFSVRDCLTACYSGQQQAPKRLFLAGGGARSQFWAQTIANCTGLPVFLSDQEEACARGSALMAGVAAGLFTDLEQALAQGSEPKRLDPDPDLVIFYDGLYLKYKKIRDAMIPIWNGG